MPADDSATKRVPTPKRGEPLLLRMGTGRRRPCSDGRPANSSAGFPISSESLRYSSGMSLKRSLPSGSTPTNDPSRPQAPPSSSGVTNDLQLGSTDQPLQDLVDP